MTYGLFFWWHSSDSIKRFSGCIRRILESLWVLELLTLVEKCIFSLEIVPLPSQYIRSLLLFMMKKIGTNLWPVLRYITLTPGNMLIFTTFREFD
jgi:hypothetical protein